MALHVIPLQPLNLDTDFPSLRLQTRGQVGLGFSYHNRITLQFTVGALTCLLVGGIAPVSISLHNIGHQAHAAAGLWLECSPRRSTSALYIIKAGVQLKAMRMEGSWLARDSQYLLRSNKSFLKRLNPTPI
jgi:hypothetical protein